MTRNGNFKRRVRARAARTGESYTSALRHIRNTSSQKSETNGLRVAVAQTSLFSDPGDTGALRAAGAEIRRLMNDAHQEGARLVHFPEGTICSPNKRLMSATGSDVLGPSDWSLVAWTVLRDELHRIAKHARELELWTVIGSTHQLTAPHRPYNSLYVISDQGELVTRYDERMLSHTKVSFMYSPGKAPMTFEVEGIRFGCALGMETHYSEIFTEYEQLNVDCILFSTTGETPEAATTFAAEVLGHAASNSYWVSYSAQAPQSVVAPAGIAAPQGDWVIQCPADGSAAVAVSEITIDPDHPARPWRRKARADLYVDLQVQNDPRSDSRNSF